jgi:hypothetical protein
LACMRFTVWTDHRPLLGIWRKQIDEIGNARCQKWRENLSIYNFNVVDARLVPKRVIK